MEYMVLDMMPASLYISNFKKNSVIDENEDKISNCLFTILLFICIMWRIFQVYFD